MIQIFGTLNDDLTITTNDGNIIEIALQIEDKCREGIRSEWMSDVFTGEAIREKIVQLNPTEREVVERLIDAVIAGERIEIEHV